MNYECKHAYETADIPYILCDREPQPSTMSKRDAYHSLCPYQRFCGQRQCAVLLPEWKHCKKNVAVQPQESTDRLLDGEPTADTPKKKSAQKRKK